MFKMQTRFPKAEKDGKVTFPEYVVTHEKTGDLLRDAARHSRFMKHIKENVWPSIFQQMAKGDTLFFEEIHRNSSMWFTLTISGNGYAELRFLVHVLSQTKNEKQYEVELGTIEVTCDKVSIGNFFAPVGSKIWRIDHV